MAKLDPTAPAVQATPAIDITKMVKRAVELQGEYAWWIIYGPSGHGKTTTIASAAANYPEKLPVDKIVSLEGVGIVQFDRTGVDSLPALGLDLPVLDLSRCTTTASIRAGINLIPAFVEKYGLQTLGIDTWTSLDKYTIADLQPKFGEKFGLYQTVLAEHGETLKTLRGLNCNVIFACHSKAKVSFKAGTDGAEVAETKELASETPGDFSISMDLSGQTKDFLRAQCSQIMPMIAEKLGKQEPDYALYPMGYQGKFEYKDRLRCFQPKEKPNLYRMMQLAKGGQSDR